jgi:hypothetical protein
MREPAHGRFIGFPFGAINGNALTNTFQPIYLENQTVFRNFAKST